LHSVASSALPAASASAARSSISPARLCIESACDCTTYAPLLAAEMLP
jgi:hypothetical protein